MSGPINGSRRRNIRRDYHDIYPTPWPVLAGAAGGGDCGHLVADMTQHTFTSLVRYALIALLFIVVGACAAMVLGSVAVCVGRMS